MNRPLGILVLTTLLAPFGLSARGDDKEATAVIDKAIAALGGEEKLTRAGTAVWKAKGTVAFGGDEFTIQTKATVQGIDRHRAEFEGDFNGNTVKGVTVLDGQKGWRKFNDDAQGLDGEALAAEQRRAYLQAAQLTVLPLKGKGFKVETAPDEKVDAKPAAVLKVTGPDGKDFTLAFDKESGLPVKSSATVKGMQGEEFRQVTTFSAYKDFGGIKRASKLDSTRDGEPFVKLEVTEFQALDKAPADAFTEPK